ncbi:MAG: glycosyltransferase [Desulfovibrio sp.]|nr:glycosyltransferase [Desulfovibrio sp.]
MIENNELVSIILPVYNSKKYIASTIESIKNQIYSNIEVIIINGSSDITTNIIKNEIKYDNRFFLFNIKNYGPGYSRNCGIKKATGKYITFIDHDDVVCPAWILSLYESIKRHSSDVSFCFFNEFEESGKNEKLCFDFITEKYYRLTLNLRNELSQILIAPWTKLVRREFLLKYDIHFSKFNLLDDVLYQYLVLQYAKSVSFCHEYLYSHRIHDNSVTGKISKNNDIFFHHFKTLYDILIYSGRHSYTSVSLIKRYRKFLSAYATKVNNKNLYNSFLDEIFYLLDRHRHKEACHLIRKLMDMKEYIKASPLI